MIDNLKTMNTTALFHGFEVFGPKVLALLN
jgi:hypothetical protein